MGQVVKKDEVRDYSSFFPRDYFNEYYAKLGDENQFLLNFFHREYQNLAKDSRVLEFGGGPTIYQILSAASAVKEIHFAEYLDANRSEIKKWLKGDVEALNWKPYLDHVSLLNGKEASEHNRRLLEDQVKSKVTEIFECDAYLPNPLINTAEDKFDIVSSNFCLECIDGRENVFVGFIEKIGKLVEKKGKLLLSLLKNAESYQIQNLNFPSFPINEEYIEKLLKSMNFSEIKIDTLHAEADQGYEGLITLSARKL